MSSSDPHTEYSQRLTARQGDVGHWAKRDRWISDLRLLVFIVGIVVAGFALGSLSWWWLGVPVFAFGVLLFLHGQIRKQLHHAERSVVFYEHGLARLEDRWMGMGVSGAELQDEGHLYAADLDLFGTGSLFELLCTARTSGGVQTLSHWLKESSATEEIRARQDAVQELRPQLDLREALVLLGPNYRADLHADGLVAWSEGSHDGNVKWHRMIVFALAAIMLCSLVGVALGLYGLGPVLIVAIVNGLYARVLKERVHEILSYVRRHGQDLALLVELLEYIETASFASPRMAVLRQQLETGVITPSQQLGKLIRLLTLYDSTRNQFFAAIAWIVLWTTQVALAIEAWRVISGGSLRGWLEVVGEFEALIALSGYAYEHPDDPFPEIVENDLAFEGEGLGHPLLPVATCVRNDIALGQPTQMMLVSGSNMSGKSTMLRTVGINAVLAMAGAPVRAYRLKCSRISVGATLRIQDSLQAGQSRFYAEITRLSHIMTLTDGPIAVLFLFDEILHGTNSHDRVIGAEAIIRRILQRKAIGLVTTHDLALTDIGSTSSPQVMNVHFDDHVDNGKIQFDYRMRPGVVKKSNALALMRAVGLEV
ncbi:MAG TPA: DNA mismatch repair protein MutS [Nitrospirales bacterium]|nr:DNA mismatch repair protein MutS [Nitrospirales bacterium]